MHPMVGSEAAPTLGLGTSPPASFLGTVQGGVLTPRAQRKKTGLAPPEDDSDTSSTGTAPTNASFEDTEALARRERATVASPSDYTGVIHRSGSNSSLKLSSSWCETGRLGGSFDQLDEAAGVGRRVKWGTREIFTIEGLETWTEEEKQETWWVNREFGGFVAVELKRRRETG